MAAKTIEAKLRIAADVAEAIRKLKALRDELLATNKAADGAGVTAGAEGAGAAATAETNQVVGQLKKRTAAERAAVAESKRLAGEKAAADKAAAREARKRDDEEAQRLRKAQVERDRAARAAKAAADKEARTRAYNAARLAPQLTDIGVGLATGQNPLTVALQQGGQLRDIYGSAGGALKALLAVLTPVRVLVGGVAAGFAVLATQIAAGYRESSQFNKTMALTGNIVGATQGRVLNLGKEIAAQGGASIGFVRESLAALLQLSGQTDSTLKATGRAVVAMARLTGESAADTVKVFADQAEGITAWSIKANKAYNFLTAAQVEYIRSLEREGRRAEAVKFANEELARALEQRGAPAIGAIERAWTFAGRAISFYLDKLRGLGRDETAEEKLDSLYEKLRRIDARIERRTSGKQATSPALEAADLREREAAVAQIDAVLNERVRTERNAEAMREQQKQIEREGKEFQQLLAGTKGAQAQQALATLEASLDAQRAAADDARARELLSEAEHARQLNAIDQARAAAQVQLAQRLLAAEQDRGGNATPAEEEAKKAALTQLQAQLIAAKARAATAVAEGQRLIDAEITKLEASLRQRQATNALAGLPGDGFGPAQRARLAAEWATEQQRKEVDDLAAETARRRAAGAGGADGQRQQQLLEANLAAARKGLDELVRRATYDDLVRQFGEGMDGLALKEKEADQLVDQYAISVEDAEKRKNDARAASLPLLREIVDLMTKAAIKPDEKNNAERAKQQVEDLNKAARELGDTWKSSVQAGFEGLFTSVLSGSKNALDAVKDFAAGVARAMLNLVAQQWASRLAVSLFGNVAAGTVSSTPSGATTVEVRHGGGVIGNGLASMTRAVSPLVFAGAQVLHGGGLVGLAPNERGVIAEVGEEMLTADNPRHIKNYRGSAGNMTFNTSITFSGEAAGSAADQRQVGEDIERRIRATVEQYVATEMRQGGKLAGLRRG